MFSQGFYWAPSPLPACGGPGSRAGKRGAGSALGAGHGLPFPAALEESVGADAAQVPAVDRQQHHGTGEGLVAEVGQLLAGYHG